MPDEQVPTPLTGQAEDVAQASELCVGCGLCCNGSLHDAAALDQDEVEAATATGLNVLQHMGKTGFAFPCPKLDDTRCTIFGQRPRVCSRFMCKVLVDLREDKLTFDEALDHVREARRLYAEMLAIKPDYLTLRDVTVMVRNNLATPGLRPVLEKGQDLQRYLDAHFRKPNDQKMIDAS
jgi:Fe-S-cluster containining protein